MSASPIKAVFFDIGNVLLRFNSIAVARKIAWAGRWHPFALAKFVWSSDLGIRLELGEISGKHLYEAFRRELGFGGSYEDFKILWCNHFKLDKEVAALYEAVAKKRPVYLLSNTNHLHYDFIRRNYAFPARASGALVSHRLKLRKPDPRIYRVALATARVKAREALFIDDLPENVDSARDLGIVGVRFTGARELRLELEALELI